MILAKDRPPNCIDAFSACSNSFHLSHLHAARPTQIAKSLARIPYITAHLTIAFISSKQHIRKAAGFYRWTGGVSPIFIPELYDFDARCWVKNSSSFCAKVWSSISAWAENTTTVEKWVSTGIREIVQPYRNGKCKHYASGTKLPSNFNNVLLVIQIRSKVCGSQGFPESCGRSLLFERQSPRKLNVNVPISMSILYIIMLIILLCL